MHGHAYDAATTCMAKHRRIAATTCIRTGCSTLFVSSADVVVSVSVARVAPRGVRVSRARVSRSGRCRCVDVYASSRRWRVAYVSRVLG